MNENERSFSADELAILELFLSKLSEAESPAVVVEAFSVLYPKLADEFASQAAAIDLLGDPELPRFDDLELEEKLGAGGMGLVYRARQVSLDRLVAVKLQRCSASAEARERFFGECRILSKLHHSSIVPIHFAGRCGGWFYCVMPLIDGANLAVVVARARGFVATGAPLPPLVQLLDSSFEHRSPAKSFELTQEYIDSSVAAVRDLADAVDFGHGKNLIHRDLKPSNAILDRSGRCWLIDFGVAVERGVSESEQHSSAAASGPSTAPSTGARRSSESGSHTPGYAAPELEDGPLSERADIWGLGLILFELLTLRAPFGGDDREAQRRAIRTGPPLADRLRQHGVAPEIVAIVGKATAVAPGQRYESARRLADDLQQFLDRRETSVLPWPWHRRLREVARHHRWLTVAVTATVVLIVALAVSLWSRDRVRARAALAELATRVARERLELANDRQLRLQIAGMLAEARRELGQPFDESRRKARRLLVDAARLRLQLAEDDSEGRQFDLETHTLHLVTLTVPSFRPSGRSNKLPDSKTHRWYVDISPAGDRAAVATSRGPLVFARDAASDERQIDDENEPHGSVEFSRRGNFLVYQSPERSLKVFDCDGRDVLFQLPDERVVAATIDHDERTLAALTDDGRLLRWRLPRFDEPSEPIQLPHHGIAIGAIDARNADVVAVEDDRIHWYGLDGSHKRSLRLRDQNAITAVRWSNDSQMLAVGWHDGRVEVVDRLGGTISHSFLQGSGIEQLRFSPDNQYVWGHFRNMETNFLAIGTGNLVAQFKDLHSVEGLSVDLRHYVAVHENSLTFGEFHTPRVRRWPLHQTRVVHQTWSADGRRLATIDTGSVVAVYEPDSRAPIFRRRLPRSDKWWVEQGHIALSTDGERLAHATGGEQESRVSIWNLKSGVEESAWLLPGGFDRLAGIGPTRFRSVREELAHDLANVSTAVREFEIGAPPPDARVLRRPETTDVRRFMGHQLSADGRLYLWAGPRGTTDRRRVELFDVEAGERVKALSFHPPLDDARPVIGLRDDALGFHVTPDDSHCFWYPIAHGNVEVGVPSRSRLVAAATVDGRWAIVSNPDQDTFRCFLARGVNEPSLIDLTAISYRWPPGSAQSFSPDSRHLAWNDGAGLLMIDLPQLAAEIDRFESEIRETGEATRP